MCNVVSAAALTPQLLSHACHRPQHKPPPPVPGSQPASANKAVRSALDALGFALLRATGGSSDGAAGVTEGSLLAAVGPLMQPYMKAKKLRRLLVEEPRRHVAGQAASRAALLAALDGMQGEGGKGGALHAPDAAGGAAGVHVACVVDAGMPVCMRA